MVCPRYLRNGATIAFASCLLALPATAFAQAASGSAGATGTSGTTGSYNSTMPMPGSVSNTLGMTTPDQTSTGTQLPNTNGTGVPGAVGPYPTNPSGAYINPNCAIAGSSCYGSGSTPSTPVVPTTPRMEAISGTPTPPETQTTTQPRRLVIRPVRLRNKRASLSKPKRIH